MGQLTNLFVSESYQGLLKLADSTTGVTGTLQYVQDGLGNNIPVQVSSTQVIITGSLIGTASYATQALSASWAPDSTDTGSLVTTSSFNAFTSSIDGRVDALEVETGSLQNQINQKLNTSSFNSYTSSNDGKVNDLISKTGSYVTETESGSFMITGSVAGDTLTFTKGNGSQFSLQVNTGSLPSGVVSGSAQIVDLGFATTSSLTSLSSSIASTDLAQNNRLTSLEGVTGSINRNGLITTGSVGGNQSITGSLNVEGTISATSASFTYVNTVYETASVIYSSGSNQFGDASNDTQTLWGTVNLPSGPLVITGSVTSTGGFTGSLQGTASYATNALSSSHAINADTASFVNSAVTASIAFDLVVYGKCDNPGGLTRGTVVRITGANGDNPLFNSASWEDDFNSANTLGMLSENVAYNGFANVVVQGTLIGINTNGMTAGDMLYLSSSGQYTTVIPPAPYHEVRLGQVLRPQLNNGSVYISIDNGYELSELHDVDIQSVQVGDVLTYVSGSYGQWVNKTVDELGYLQTSSFNSYTASMDARTGSYITTGSAAGSQSITGSLILSGSAGVELDVKGDQTNTGSVNISGSLDVNGPVSLLPGTGLPTTPGLNLGGNTSNKLWVSGSNNDVYLRSATDMILTVGNNGNFRISGPGGTTPISSSIVGNTTITGSVVVRSGDLDLYSSTTPNIDNFLTSSVGSSNIIRGWGENPTQGGAGANIANYTGSLRITGSNNTVSLPQIRATNFGGGTDMQGYISGSDNILQGNNGGIYLNTGSQLFPKTLSNFLGANSWIQMNYTTSSLAGGHPVMTNNTLYGGSMLINSNSGSIQSLNVNLMNAASLTSTQNFTTNTRPNITQNIFNGAATNLNHISSSINVQGNLNISPLTINNHLSSSIANNSVLFQSNTILGGGSNTGLGIWVSGSQNSNVTRNIQNNLIGGSNIIVSSSFVSSSNANLVSTLIYGNGLNVSGSHTAGTLGGSAFLGRFNDITSLHLAQDVVFAVGTGTAAGTRRTGLYVTSGSLVGVSGSLLVSGSATFNGDTTMSSSTTFPLTVDGTINSKRLHFTANPFNSNPSSNLGAIRFEGNNQTFYSTNYDLAQITTQSMVFQTVVTGSNLVETGLRSNNRGSDYNLILTNQSGTGSLTTNANVFVTGSMNVSSIMNLAPQNPLPAGNIGDLAVSSSNQIYFYNGAWTLIV